MLADLRHQIDAFAATLEALIRDYPSDADFWPEFAQAASEAQARVFAEQRRTFQDAVVSLLRRHGKLSPSGPVGPAHFDQT